jgi:hypothetical protein
VHEGCVESETANQGIHHHPSVLEEDVNVSYQFWFVAILEIKKDRLLSRQNERDLRPAF